MPLPLQQAQGLRVAVLHLPVLHLPVLLQPQLLNQPLQLLMKQLRYQNGKLIADIVKLGKIVLVHWKEENVQMEHGLLKTIRTHR